MTLPLLPTPDATTPYHWTPTSQRQFLEALAETGSVTRAAAAVAMSPRSAHKLRHRRDGAAFRIGWDAALLIARAALADSLMERAIDGQVETVTRDGETLTRRRHDNRLGMSLLTRLDRIAETDLAAGTDGALANLVSQDFEAFLDLVERGGAGAEAALFVAARTPADPAGIEDNGWCELGAPDEPAAEPEPADPETRAAAMGVWEDEYLGGLLTDFPPPPGFGGKEKGRFGDDGYSRSLTGAERAIAEARLAEQCAPLAAAGEAARDAWFGFAPPPADEVAARDGEQEQEDAKAAEAAWRRPDEPIDRDGQPEAEPPLDPLPAEPPEPVEIAPSDDAPPPPPPLPDCVIRTIRGRPRPVPYANGRPPDYVYDFNPRPPW